MLDGSPPNHGFNTDLLRWIGVTGYHAAGWTGHGVAIGFADYGFDLAHPVFALQNDGASRFRTLACQASRLHLEAPASSAPEAAGYEPHGNYYGPNRRADPREGAHGTLMASIAAGSACDGFTGIAPDADIDAVHLDLPDEAWKEQDASGRPAWRDWNPSEQPVWAGWRSYADSPAIASAIEALYWSARKRTPAGIVLNLSIGTWAGAHDGRGRVARTIAEITERSDRGDGPPCAVVIGAGNAGRDHGHVTGTLVPGEQTRMVWEFPPGARATDKLEIWFDGPFMPADRRLRCRIASQDTPHAPRATVDIAPGATVEVLIDGTRVGVADYTPNASGALGRIRISLAPHAASDTLRGAASEAAEWHIWLSLPDGAQASSTFHAWRERNDDPRRSILRDADLSSTLCDFACAPGAIVAGGIRSPGPAPEGSSHGHSQRAPSIFDHASRGPRPWSTGKAATEVPHVAAPADLVWGARSCAGDFTRTSGTSAAAAVVSGCIALLYQRAAAIGIRLGRDDLIMLLTGSPFQPPLMHARQRRRAWRPDLGFGTLRLHDDRQPHQLEGGSP